MLVKKRKRKNTYTNYGLYSSKYIKTVVLHYSIKNVFEKKCHQGMYLIKNTVQNLFCEIS